MLRHWTTFIHYYLGLKSSTKIPDHYPCRRDGNFDRPLNYGDSTQKIDAKTLQKDSIIVVASLAFSFRPRIAYLKLKKTSQGRTMILSGWDELKQLGDEFVEGFHLLSPILERVGNGIYREGSLWYFKHVLRFSGSPPHRNRFLININAAPKYIDTSASM